MQVHRQEDLSGDPTSSAKVPYFSEPYATFSRSAQIEHKGFARYGSPKVAEAPTWPGAGCLNLRLAPVSRSIVSSACDGKDVGVDVENTRLWRCGAHLRGIPWQSRAENQELVRDVGSCVVRLTDRNTVCRDKVVVGLRTISIASSCSTRKTYGSEDKVVIRVLIVLHRSDR